MSSVADAPLEDLAREADRSTVVEFVAGLFSARGWTVERLEDSQLLLSREGTETRLAVVHPSDEERGGESGADRIVVVGETDGDIDADTVDASALRRQLAYAIDREDAHRLLETHFGWTPDRDGAVNDGDASTGSPDGNRSTVRARVGGPFVTPGAGEWLAVVGVLVVAVLLAGVAVGLSGSDGSTGLTDVRLGEESEPTGETPATESESMRDEEGSAVGVRGATPWESERSQPGNGTDETIVVIESLAGEDGTYAQAPPGIEGPNEIYVHEVAGGFLQALDNTSYRLRLTYREQIDGQTTGVYTELLRVESNERYAVSVSRVGRLRTRPLTIAGSDLYADGAFRYARLDDAPVRIGPTTTYNPFMFNTTQYLGWFFSVRNSTITDQQTRGNTTTYHVATSGDPDPEMQNASGDMYVTGDGLLRYGRWEYTPADHPGVRVVFEMRVSGVGSTEAVPPAWARNASAVDPST